MSNRLLLECYISIITRSQVLPNIRQIIFIEFVFELEYVHNKRFNFFVIQEIELWWQHITFHLLCEFSNRFAGGGERIALCRSIFFAKSSVVPLGWNVNKFLSLSQELPRNGCLGLSIAGGCFDAFDNIRNGHDCFPDRKFIFKLAQLFGGNIRGEPNQIW